MESLTETEVRASFVNATKGEIARMNLPPDLDQQRWAELDLLAGSTRRRPTAATSSCRCRMGEPQACSSSVPRAA